MAAKAARRSRAERWTGEPAPRPPLSPGRRHESDVPWDLDVNIFDPGEPSRSPHWRSSDGPKNTYGTKWSVRFSERVQQWGVPPIVYLAALVESCENSLQGSVPFWEGAVRVYKDAACTEAIGYGFVEQMGYN